MPTDHAPDAPPGHDRSTSPVIDHLGHGFILRPLPPEDGGGYWIAFPEVFGCQAHGATVGEAIENGRAALALWLRSTAAAGRPVPPVVRDDRAAAVARRRAVTPALRWAEPGTGRPPPRLDPGLVRTAARAREAAVAVYGDRLRRLILSGCRIHGDSYYFDLDLTAVVVLAGDGPFARAEAEPLFHALLDRDPECREIFVSPVVVAERELAPPSIRGRLLLDRGVEVGLAAPSPPGGPEDAGAVVERLMHAMVRLIGDHPAEGVRAGTVGAVVSVCPDVDPPGVLVEVGDCPAPPALVATTVDRIEVVG